MSAVDEVLASIPMDQLADRLGGGRQTRQGEAGGGGVLGQILGQVLGGGRQGQPTTDSGGGFLDDLLSGMLGKK